MMETNFRKERQLLGKGKTNQEGVLKIHFSVHPLSINEDIEITFHHLFMGEKKKGTWERNRFA